MRVRIARVTGMPCGVVVWVDRQPWGPMVHIAESLFHGGALTYEGRALAEAALACGAGNNEITEEQARISTPLPALPDRP